MRPFYIWQYETWPDFSWDSARIEPLLGKVRNLQGQVVGMALFLESKTQNETVLDVMTQDILNSSAIEGEYLKADSVRSSLARQLGIEREGVDPDHYTEGVVQITIDAVRNHQQPLTAERLFNWHAALFPYGRTGIIPITVADWRKGEDPMLVVSGAMGKERIHYQAPASDDVPSEMERFLDWFNNNNEIDSVLKAAVAHLWFVSIHPFDDGNGRLTRTLTDMLLTRSDGLNHRFYSMSAEIMNQRKDYYEILEKSSCSDTDISEWIIWFLKCMYSALETTVRKVQKVVEKKKFWDVYGEMDINEHQRKIINMLWDGFEGKLNSSKWAKINKCSADTALREIKDLIEKGILRKTSEGGRSSNYEFACCGK